MLNVDPAVQELAPTNQLSLADALLYYLDHPVEWVEDIIGITLDEWQKNVLNAIAREHFVTVRSGHGVGKSCMSACAILWFLCTHPFSKVVCTAPTKEQLFDVLWAECYRWIRESKKLAQLVEWRTDKIVMRSNPEEWFAIARTAEIKKLGKTGLAVAEGLQGRHAESLLYVLDEASGIDEAIMHTIDGALTSEESFVLMIGNPTRTSGTFFDAFNKKRSMWKCFKVSCEDSPRVAKSWIARMLAKYGSRDNPLFRIKVLGEFPLAQSDAVFGLQAVEAAVANDLTPAPFERYEIGVDVARYGNNKTAFTIRQGPKVVKIETCVNKSTMETAGKTIQYIRQYNPITVKVDVCGVGGGVVDRLRELNYKQVIAVDNGSAPFDTRGYVNTRAEHYWNLRTLINTNQVNLPDDEDLIAEMTSITYKVTSRGKILIESKEEMLARGIESPDRLDSVVLAFANAQRKRQAASFVNLPFMAR